MMSRRARTFLSGQLTVRSSRLAELIGEQPDSLNLYPGIRNKGLIVSLRSLPVPQLVSTLELDLPRLCPFGTVGR